MTSKVLTRETEAAKRNKGHCAHYWIIDPPDGPVSRGVCKICGDEKEFNNYAFYPRWESKSFLSSGLGIGFGKKPGSGDAGDTIFLEKRNRRLSHGRG